MDNVYIPAYETEVVKRTFYVRKKTLEFLTLRLVAIKKKYNVFEHGYFRIKEQDILSICKFGLWYVFARLDMAVNIQQPEMNVSEKVKVIAKGKAVVPYW